MNEIFKNQDLRTGGFFELCIQVSESSNENVIKKYFDFFWNQAFIQGPFDENLNDLTKELDYRLEGILNLGNVSIPFINFNIREENPLESGSYWFDISFYITTIEKLYNLEPQNWDENSNCPKELSEYLLYLMLKLYDIRPFNLALLDFEISGEYRLEDLKNNDFVNWTNSILYIGKENLNKVNKNNLKYVKIINE